MLREGLSYHAMPAGWRGRGPVPRDLPLARALCNRCRHGGLSPLSRSRSITLQYQKGGRS
jgi:hypothetical protein